MNKVQKSAAALFVPDSNDLDLINVQALVPFGSLDEVFVFRATLADTRVDRDSEQFTAECLAALAPMFVGKTVIRDHAWATDAQTARVYFCGTETDGGETLLVARIYIPRLDTTAGIIREIETGLRREMSVGVRIGKRTCSICGENIFFCDHSRGKEYDGKMCVGILSEPRDAYEVSLVAVPSQRGAGVRKSCGECADGGENITVSLSENDIDKLAEQLAAALSKCVTSAAALVPNTPPAEPPPAEPSPIMSSFARMFGRDK